MRAARPLTTCLLALPLVLAGCGSEPGSGFPSTGTQTGGVQGSICIPSGIGPVRGALVSVFPDEDEDGSPDSETPSAATATDVNGEFVFEDLEAGSYVGVATRGHLEFSFPVAFGAGNRATLSPACFPSDGINVTQIGGTCDDPASLLEDMGFEVTAVGTGDQAWLDLLTNASDIEDVDILLLPCGLPADWAPQSATVTSVISGWMEDGGSLYVSGTSWPILEALDEDLIDFFRDDEDVDAPAVGFGGNVAATVLDPTLGELFPSGSTTVRMAENWIVLESVGDEATALLTGDAQTVDFETVPASPLLVTSESTTRGTITYSTFGTSGESNEAMDDVLSEMLLSL